jgi:hypothetical protein
MRRRLTLGLGDAGLRGQRIARTRSLPVRGITEDPGGRASPSSGVDDDPQLEL